MRLGGGIEDRGELVHERDEPDREPGEVPLAALGKPEQPGTQREDDEDAEEGEVQPEEDEEGHASSSAAKRPSRAATPSARAPAGAAGPRAFPAGRRRPEEPLPTAAGGRAPPRSRARPPPARAHAPHTATPAGGDRR